MFSILVCFIVVLSITTQITKGFQPSSITVESLGQFVKHKLDLNHFHLQSIARESSTQINTVINSASNYPKLRLKDSVKSLLNENYCKVYDNDTVFTAVETMNNFNKGSSIVVNSEGELSGIFTERDFVNKIVDAEKPYSETIIGSVMTPRSKLIVAPESSSLGECRSIMIENNIRHLPIISESDGKPIGIISMREIIRSLQMEDMKREQARLFGATLGEVQQQSKSLANQLAFETGTQDYLRTGFVLLAACVGAALLQGDWMHDHEWLSMSLTFLLGYIGIIFENYFEFNKAGIALLMSTALWVIYAGTAGSTGVAVSSALQNLAEKVSEVSEVVFFILGAMTIVEIVDSHQGFKVITDRIKSKSKRGLMWVLGLITFFMSAALDNLTTTIVMVSLVKKILPSIDDRKLFGAMIVVAANAGGAWTPIGDVTTTMLWINGQISALPTITSLLLPSLFSITTTIFLLQGQIPEDELVPERDETADSQLAPRGQLVFGTGIAGLLSVPVFKALTGLPPYLGMLASLGVMWSLTDAIHAGEKNENLMAPAALKKIDTSGVLFFLGILLSVGALDSAGILRSIAEFLDQNIPNQSIVATLIGIASSLIDNVPLVAATMGMYRITDVPMDSQLWQLIAFCAGTGGSLLIIGSAAGVALMGLEKVDFLWYAKKVSLSAAAGYIVGISTYLLQSGIMQKSFG